MYDFVHNIKSLAQKYLHINNIPVHYCYSIGFEFVDLHLFQMF